MAYGPQQHGHWVDRAQAACVALYALTLEEVEALQLVFLNEASSGSDPAFVDHNGITKAELIAGLDTLKEVLSMLQGTAPTLLRDRRPDLLPFVR